MDADRRLVAVGREGEVEDEEDQAGGGDEPQLHHRVGADEEDHLVRVRVRVSPSPITLTLALTLTRRATEVSRSLRVRSTASQ